MSSNTGPGAGIFAKFGHHLRQVWRLLAPIQFSDCPDDAPHRELRTLAAPHMRVLVHKRERLVTAGGFALSGPWLAKLSTFADSIERYLTADLARDRRRVLGMLDDIVWAAQLENSLAAPAPLPATSRFDMRWAN
jgi:hypothetical protein